MKTVQAKLFFGLVSIASFVACGGTSGSASDTESTVTANGALTDLETCRADHKACVDKAGDADKTTCEADAQACLKAVEANHRPKCAPPAGDGEAPKLVVSGAPGGDLDAMAAAPGTTDHELDGGHRELDGGHMGEFATNSGGMGPAAAAASAAPAGAAVGGGMAPPCEPPTKEAPTAAIDKCITAIDDCLKAGTAADTCAAAAIACLVTATHIHLGVEPVAPTGANAGGGQAGGGKVPPVAPHFDGGGFDFDGGGFRSDGGRK